MDFFTKQNDKEIEVLKRLADSLQQMHEADKSLDFSEEIEAVRIAAALFTMIGEADKGPQAGQKNGFSIYRGEKHEQKQ